MGFNSGFKGLKSDNKDMYFTRRPMYFYDHISLKSCYNEKLYRPTCRENQTAHLYSFFFENVAYEIMWKNTVQPDRSQMKIRRIRIACWILKATDTHSEYVIIIASPR